MHKHIASGPCPCLSVFMGFHPLVCIVITTLLNTNTFMCTQVGKNVVTCDVKQTDMYGRNVAVCSLAANGEQLNAWLVSNGWAVAYK